MSTLRAFIARHIIGPDLWGGDLSHLDRMDGVQEGRL